MCDDRSYGVNNREYRRNRRHINPVPPRATDEEIGPEQINGSDPVNEDDTVQASPAVPFTSVHTTILKRSQPKNEQTKAMKETSSTDQN
jgi:hypothetical protein